MTAIALALSAAITLCLILVARFALDSIDRGTAFRTLDAEPLYDLDAVAVELGINLYDVDRCDDCEVVLHHANRAITCGAHSLCVGCNADHNPCRECAYWAADAEANGSNL